MRDQFVTLEIAKKLKELGFNEPCFAIHRGNEFKIVTPSKDIINSLFGDVIITIPLWLQVKSWLTRVKRVAIEINISTAPPNRIIYTWTHHNFLIKPNDGAMVTTFGTEIYNSYEQALEAAILYTLNRL